MKINLLLLFSICFALGLQAQGLKGAWEYFSLSKDGDSLKRVVIFSEAYQVSTIYNSATGKFIETNGGTWDLNNNTLTETVEFHSSNPEMVGNEISFEISMTDENEFIIEENGEKFKRLDNGTPGQLQGAWLMSGRVKDGKTQSRDTNRPRKTMKILSGTRFQWIAYNTETKEFKGTGGGTYSTENGAYSENIEFFSKNNSKVGLNLKFNYDLKDGEWHHTGFSSKGDPIHEIWSLRPRSN
ncbi:hypothetical protein LX97_01972 [Nonlabens dokdonensis]|jgi:hypothetical protein|uniref:Membrane or secreted protein n=2 Tax=Nonlabens dokdonensis TaxID=328515 RepID=L7WCC6_NONDD|nr:hypothetical protein [Nonlabens dokdonensis]AGC77852.1 membrane or secreted protein [Nonlabens dokdonensis DSW-6]PZX39618.1 hypothetical protein LX97_01972 [Nonlabens dokdonensis]